MIGSEFSCADRNGVTIICSRECWSKHIIASHLEIADQQGLIKAIIEKPGGEYQDVRHVDTKSYYKQLVLPTVGNTLVKVSIEYRKVMGKDRGFVKTAYATDKVKKGEVWLWGQKLPQETI